MCSQHLNLDSHISLGGWELKAVHVVTMGNDQLGELIRTSSSHGVQQRSFGVCVCVRRMNVRTRFSLLSIPEVNISADKMLLWA